MAEISLCMLTPTTPTHQRTHDTHDLSDRHSTSGRSAPDDPMPRRPMAARTFDFTPHLRLAIPSRTSYSPDATYMYPCFIHILYIIFSVYVGTHLSYFFVCFRRLDFVFRLLGFFVLCVLFVYLLRHIVSTNPLSAMLSVFLTICGANGTEIVQ
jgi:hypothetical protein